MARQDNGHFEWQTVGPYVAARERELVHAAFLPLERRVLDVGCGHGATLRHLGDPDGAVGIDIEEAKIAYAREQISRCRFVAGTALELPFADGEFDQVIIRDVIHHIEDPTRVIHECHRVLGPTGRIDILEPSRYNPLIFLHGLLLQDERGELRSTARYIRGILEPKFAVVSTRRFQPLPIHRLVFHPKLGFPRATQRLLPRLLVGGLEELAGHVMPEWAWAYLHVRAFRSSLERGT